MKIFVTGVTGFIGSAVVKELTRLQRNIKTVVRKPDIEEPNLDQIVVDSIDSKTDWTDELIGCDVIVHCAARVHIMNDRSSDPLADFREVNTQGTLKLAREAARSGVKRFVFISTIKVSGEETLLGEPFKYSDKPAPVDPYSISKYEAEEGLKKLSKEFGIEIVIIRPTLVYGPGVKANFQNMMRWLNKGIPLPLGAIDNLRSLVSLGNLVDLIVTCVDYPGALNETFLVSDDRDVSTTELLNLLSNALQKNSLIIPFNIHVIKLLLKLVGKSDFSNRLCCSLQVDINHTKEVLNWKPPMSIEKSLLSTANAYQESLKS